MKTTIKHIFTAFCLVSTISVTAQRGNIRIFAHEVSRSENTVTIVLEIEAKNLNIRSNRSQTLTPILSTDSFRQSLRPVIYTGGQRHKFDHRVHQIAGNTPAIEPYQINNRIKVDQIYKTHYTVTIPYRQWMDNASLSVIQIENDCCNQWQLSQSTLITNIDITQRHDWIPDPQVYRSMISFAPVTAESFKTREESATVNIDYPVNVYRVVPEYGDNKVELYTVDTLMTNIVDNALITLNSVYITGYASPEGPSAANDVLARNRAMGFRSYIKERFKLGSTPTQIDWVAEDWEGLVSALTQSNDQYRNRVVEIITSTDGLDQRESKLKMLDDGIAFEQMLSDIFPGLRRIELRANFRVANLDHTQSRELIYSRPNLMSLAEITDVAKDFTAGTVEHRQVYEIAAHTFPKDTTASNNAAAAALLMGDTKSARRYMAKYLNASMMDINRGVAWYIDGDLVQASKWFQKAADAGNPIGESNLRIIKQHDNIKYK